jgi:hypothetical protein
MYCISKGKIISCFLLILTVAGCSYRSFVISQITPVLETSATAIYQESDLKVAEQALASNLKLVEGLLQNDRDNERLLLLAAQGWAGYALGFAEDDNADRAKIFYLRARNYARANLAIDHPLPEFAGQSWDNWLSNLDKTDTAPLFWMGFAWAGLINLSLNDPAVLADLPLVEKIIHRVAELDSGYFFGSVYLLSGSVYGMKPKMMGGDPAKAAASFEKNFKLNNQRFLLAYVYAARYYAARILDEDLFDRYIEHVLQAPAESLPGMQLLNQIARQKAEKLKLQKENLF